MALHGPKKDKSHPPIVPMYTQRRDAAYANAPESLREMPRKKERVEVVIQITKDLKKEPMP